jgi:hypothetical protein
VNFYYTLPPGKKRKRRVAPNPLGKRSFGVGWIANGIVSSLLICYFRFKKFLVRLEFSSQTASKDIVLV